MAGAPDGRRAADVDARRLHVGDAHQRADPVRADRHVDLHGPDEGGSNAFRWLPSFWSSAYSVSGDERLQRFRSLQDPEFIAQRIGDSVNLSFLELVRNYPLGNGLGGGGTSVPYFPPEPDPQRRRHGERVRADPARARHSGLLMWVLFIGWIFTRRHIREDDMFYFGRRLAYVACACTFATGLIGTGLFTSVPIDSDSAAADRVDRRAEVAFAPVAWQGATPRRRAPPAVNYGRGLNARPWVIVAGGFHEHGGMDRANAALARICSAGVHRVHLVGHEIDRGSARTTARPTHAVPRSEAAAPRSPNRCWPRGARWRERRAPASGARVVVNGGNCLWPDINWVHAVTRPGRSSTTGAVVEPIPQPRLKAAASRARAAPCAGAVVIANSEATRRAADRTRRRRPRASRSISDPNRRGAGAGERRVGARRARTAADAPVVAFVGALGSDINKGSTCCGAWKRLAPSAEWDAPLVVAGGGWRVPAGATRRRAAAAAGRSVSSASHDDVREVLAAADLLVSPVRYEAYGLNVHEALCRGLAVMVTRTAGVVERFDATWTKRLLPETSRRSDAERLRAWRSDVDGWRARAASTAARLRARSWDDMAAELVAVVTLPPGHVAT